MITVKQFLAATGLVTPVERIKLIRHSDHDGRSIRQIIEEGWFNVYQAEQRAKVKPFHASDVIAAFVAGEGKLAEFQGVYEVRGSRVFRMSDFRGAPGYLRKPVVGKKDRLWYDLREIGGFESLRGRLMVEWRSPRVWFQKKDLPIYQIRPPGRLLAFPGYQDIVLSREELKYVTDTPQLHRDWKVALSATAGIYRIVDTKTGKIYIGSAYGAQGIWGRWTDYARDGHGGNKLLKPLDPARFRWSIVRTLSGSMSEKEVIQIERIEMEKHGSRAVGLNS